MYRWCGSWDRSIAGKVVRVDGGYSLEPARRLTPNLVEYVLSVARIQEGDRICRGLKNPYTVCCKPLAVQNRSGYCKNHRHQSPSQKAAVKKAKK